MTPARADVLSLADHVVLALLGEQPRHGWALVRELAPDGPIGRVWSLSRPLTYRSLEALGTRRLVRARATVPGRGPHRTVMAVTPAGRRRTRTWLATPVEHLRDVRTVLLLKLVLAERLGLATTSLLRAQELVFVPMVTGLARAADADDADLVDRWRSASAHAAVRFVVEEQRRATRRA